MTRRIAAYLQLRRTLAPTGVGKHIINMSKGLASHPDVSLTAMASRFDVKAALQALPEDNLASRIPVRAYPVPSSVMEAAWLLAPPLSANPWLPEGAEWLYLPSEVYVPVKNVQTAATFHCVNWFEPTLPWFNDPDTRRTRRFMGLRFNSILKSADRILAVSEFLKSRIIALFAVPESRISVVYNGVEPVYFSTEEMSRPSSVPEDRPYFLVIGGLTRRKGGKDLLALARRLCAKAPDIAIIIAGASEPELHAQATILPNVIHVGYKTSAELSQLLRHSMGLLFLSRYETFGIPAAEAMATATPTIVAHHAALPEVVGDGGLIVDPQQTEALADLCLELVNNPRLRRDVGERGRRRADAFRWEACVARLLRAM